MKTDKLSPMADGTAKNAGQVSRFPYYLGVHSNVGLVSLLQKQIVHHLYFYTALGLCRQYRHGLQPILKVF